MSEQEFFSNVLSFSIMEVEDFMNEVTELMQNRSANLENRIKEIRSAFNNLHMKTESAETRLDNVSNQFGLFLRSKFIVKSDQDASADLNQEKKVVSDEILEEEEILDDGQSDAFMEKDLTRGIEFIESLLSSNENDLNKAIQHSNREFPHVEYKKQAPVKTTVINDMSDSERLDSMEKRKQYEMNDKKSLKNVKSKAGKTFELRNWRRNLQEEAELVSFKQDQFASLKYKPSRTDPLFMSSSSDDEESLFKASGSNLKARSFFKPKQHHVHQNSFSTVKPIENTLKDSSSIGLSSLKSALKINSKWSSSLEGQIAVDDIDSKFEDEVVNTDVASGERLEISFTNFDDCKSLDKQMMQESSASMNKRAHKRLPATEKAMDNKAAFKANLNNVLKRRSMFPEVNQEDKELRVFEHNKIRLNDEPVNENLLVSLTKTRPKIEKGRRRPSSRRARSIAVPVDLYRDEDIIMPKRNDELLGQKFTIKEEPSKYEDNTMSVGKLLTIENNNNESSEMLKKSLSKPSSKRSSVRPEQTSSQRPHDEPKASIILPKVKSLQSTDLSPKRVLPSHAEIKGDDSMKEMIILNDPRHVSNSPKKTNIGAKIKTFEARSQGKVSEIIEDSEIIHHEVRKDLDYKDKEPDKKKKFQDLLDINKDNDSQSATRNHLEPIKSGEHIKNKIDTNNDSLSKTFLKEKKHAEVNGLHEVIATSSKLSAEKVRKANKDQRISFGDRTQTVFSKPMIRNHQFKDSYEMDRKPEISLNDLAVNENTTKGEVNEKPVKLKKATQVFDDQTKRTKTNDIKDKKELQTKVSSASVSEEILLVSNQRKSLAGNKEDATTEVQNPRKNSLDSKAGVKSRKESGEKNTQSFNNAPLMVENSAKTPTVSILDKKVKRKESNDIIQDNLPLKDMEKPENESSTIIKLGNSAKKSKETELASLRVEDKEFATAISGVIPELRGEVPKSTTIKTYERSKVCPATSKPSSHVKTQEIALKDFSLKKISVTILEDPRQLSRNGDKKKSLKSAKSDRSTQLNKSDSSELEPNQDTSPTENDPDPKTRVENQASDSKHSSGEAPKFRKLFDGSSSDNDDVIIRKPKKNLFESEESEDTDLCTKL